MRSSVKAVGLQLHNLLLIKMKSFPCHAHFFLDGPRQKLVCFLGSPEFGCLMKGFLNLSVRKTPKATYSLSKILPIFFQEPFEDSGALKETPDGYNLRSEE
jgi:hypothetical protein